jgi:hypothetical protein
LENSDDELDYLQRENAHLEKQHKIEHLCAPVLGENTHQCSESLDSLAEPPAHKRPTPVILPTKCSTILPFHYGGHKQKNLAIVIHRVENVLEFDLAVYPTERDRMIFAKLYLVSDASAV